MTNKEAFIEFAQGFATGLGIVGVFILLNTVVTPNNSTPNKKFAVVDTYKGCDVVRYTDSSTRWNYFLDCQKQP